MGQSNGEAEQIETEREQLRAEWRRSGLHRGTNVIEILHEQLPIKRENRVRFFASGREADLSVGDIYAAGDRVATALLDLGVPAQATIAIHVPNWPEALTAIYASLLLRATIVPIPSIYGPTEVRFILEDAGVDTYIVADRWRSNNYIDALPVVTTAKGLERVIVVGSDVPSGCIAWSEVEDRAALAEPTKLEQFHVAGDALSFCIYTSGSTSKPKGARHSHDTMLFEFAQCQHRYARPAAHLQAFPGGHVAGLLGTVGPLLYGSSLYVLDHWDADLAADLISEFRLGSVSGAPFYLATLLDAAGRKGTRLDSIEDMLVGSAAVPPSLIERAEDAGFHPYRCYGSTEHPTISSNDPLDSLEARSRTDGAILDAVEVRIVDEEGTTLEDGREGEILSRGPDQFLSYTDAEANAEALVPGGWFRTGDIGWLTPEGRLVISDRKKDVIIRGGENLSSQEIEDILVRHPAVSQAAVVGAPDPLYGERAYAFVVLRPGIALTLDDVREHFRGAGVARQKTPEGLVIKDELPRTAAGKVKKFLLRSELESNAEAAPAGGRSTGA
jgi:acyl-CoA synthetase (AMP-forming)/AMP-acid ligase II